MYYQHQLLCWARYLQMLPNLVFLHKLSLLLSCTFFKLCLLFNKLITFVNMKENFYIQKTYNLLMNTKSISLFSKHFNSSNRYIQFPDSNLWFVKLAVKFCLWLNKKNMWADMTDQLIPKWIKSWNPENIWASNFSSGLKSMKHTPMTRIKFLSA